MFIPPIPKWDLCACGAEEVGGIVGAYERRHMSLTAIVSIDSTRQIDVEKLGRSSLWLSPNLRSRQFIFDCPDSSCYQLDKNAATQLEEGLWKLFDFVRKRADEDGGELRLLAHCAYGISRSPAVLLLLIRALNADWTPESCIEKLLRIRMEAEPNMEIVRIGSEILGFGTSLTEAIECHPLLGRKLAWAGYKAGPSPCPAPG